MTLSFIRLPGLIAIAAALLASPPVRAEIRDNADFFSDQAERQATELAQRIRQQRGKDIVVETVPELQGAPAPGLAREEFYLKEVTRRGKEAGVDGLYILVSKNPQSFYIGVDPETQKREFTLKDRARVRELLLARFKNKDFDRGILAALEEIDKTLAANVSGTASGAAAAAGVAGSSESSGTATSPGTTSSAPRSTPTGGVCGRGGGIFGWVLLIAGAFIVFRIIRGFMGRQQQQQQQAPGGLGAPGYGQPGYGQPGYDPRYPQGGGGGGMGRGILGGVLGGVAGGYLYDQMRGQGGNEAQAAPPPLDPSTTPVESPDSTSGFADFGSGGSDMGGGGDFGGGDGGGGGDF